MSARIFVSSFRTKPTLCINDKGIVVRIDNEKKKNNDITYKCETENRKKNLLTIERIAMISKANEAAEKTITPKIVNWRIDVFT